MMDECFFIRIQILLNTWNTLLFTLSFNCKAIQNNSNKFNSEWNFHILNIIQNLITFRLFRGLPFNEEPLQLLNTIVILWWSEGLQGPYNWASMMPRDTNFSDSYTSDRCCTQRNLFEIFLIQTEII